MGRKIKEWNFYKIVFRRKKLFEKSDKRMSLKHIYQR